MEVWDLVRTERFSQAGVCLGKWILCRWRNGTRRALICVASLAVMAGSFPGQEPESGTVRVTVVDEKEKPIEGAIVDAQRTVYPSAAMHQCWTGSSGTCTLGIPPVDENEAAAGIQPPVVYRLSASKYYSGYRPLVTSGPCPPATEEVTADEIRQGRSVTLHIGPKAGIVRMTITDAETGKRLQGDVDFEWSGPCPEKFIDGMGLAGGDLLVAPNVPIEVAVESPGYARWEYKSGKAVEKKTFMLRPEEVMTFDVRLHPKK